MSKLALNILYVVTMVVIVVLFVVIKEMSEVYQMFLGATAIILTSIFSYSNRYAILRRRDQESD